MRLLGRIPNYYRFVPRTNSGLHPFLRKPAFYRTSTSAVLPAERANFDSKEAPSLAPIVVSSYKA